MKHKHYDCIVAWAEGKKIEANYGNGVWLNAENPNWSNDNEYRIKKEPVIEVKYFAIDISLRYLNYFEIQQNLVKWDLKITYQDGKAIKVELPDEN